MSFQISKKYKVRAFDVGSIRKVFVELEGLFEGDHRWRINASYRFKDDVIHEKELKLEDLDLVTELTPPLKGLSLTLIEDMTIKLMVILICESDPADFHVIVQATAAEKCREAQSILKSKLGLTEVPDTYAAKYEPQISVPNAPRGLQAERKEPEYPEKVTIKWLYQNVPLSAWIWLASLLIAAFGLGVMFAETKLYDNLKTSAQEEVTANDKT
jgi:hypothetical protein